MDQGYLVVSRSYRTEPRCTGPPTSTTYSIASTARIPPGWSAPYAIEGLSGSGFDYQVQCLDFLFLLNHLDERIGHPEQSATAIATKPAERIFLNSGCVCDCDPASFGARNGECRWVQLEIEDHRNDRVDRVAASDRRSHPQRPNAEPGLTSVFTTFRSQGPQLFLNIDREKVQALMCRSVPCLLPSRVIFGSNYVDDFKLPGANLSGKLAK